MENFVSKLECMELASIMEAKYSSYLDNRTFKIVCKKAELAVEVTITLSNVDESYVYPVETRMNYLEEELKPREAALFLVNYVDSYFEDFLTDGESVLLPIAWKAMSYEGNDFLMKGQILNKRAERWADDILASNEAYAGPNVIKF